MFDIALVLLILACGLVFPKKALVQDMYVQSVRAVVEKMLEHDIKS
jgi:hypothetical protein